MNASARQPVFRMSKNTGFATMAELWRAALFLSDLMNWDIQIEGVTHVSPNAAGVYLDAPPVPAGGAAAGAGVAPKAPKYVFKRRSGTALFKELQEFGAFVREQLVRRGMESNDFTSGDSGAENTQVEFRKA